MTISMEQNIEELRLELRNVCDAAERRQIAAELEFAQAELALMIAEQTDETTGEAPF